MFGRRKLRDPKDECAWVHDGLKEMNLHETHNSEVFKFHADFFLEQSMMRFSFLDMHDVFVS